MKFLLAILLTLNTLPALAISCSQVLTTPDFPYLNPENLNSQLKYIQVEKRKVPYLDLSLKPKGKERGTVLLIQGFQQTVGLWIDQTNALLQKGYRVISYELSNAGENLRLNGIKELEFGEGFEYDAKLGLAVLQTLKPREITLMGYSRGGMVASILAEKIIQLKKKNINIKIKELVLFSPYSGNHWGKGYFQGFQWIDVYEALEDDPSGLADKMTNSFFKGSDKKNEDDSFTALKKKAYGHLLKGTYPIDLVNQPTTLPFVKKIVSKNTSVKVVTGDNDTFFTPLETLEELSIKGVEFRVLEGEDHFWVSTSPPAFFVEQLFK